MTWPAMTVGEYAALERRLGTGVVNIEGVWWRRARPLFYRPLFPFEPLPAAAAAPPAGRLGGWQHALADPRLGNSHLNFMVFKNLQPYEPASLKREDRKNLRRAARFLTYRRITDLEEFASEGLRILREFFSRSNYRFRRDRRRPRIFRRWAAALLAEPRVLVLGAYSRVGLCEVHISFRVRDVIFFEVAFASQEGRLLRSSDGILDYLRRQAARTDAAFITLGPAGVKERLDGFKLRRGAEVLSLPARLHLSPPARAVLGLLARGTYARLGGMDEDQAIAYSAACPRA